MPTRITASVSAIQAAVQEMASPANRQKLWYGIWSGYAIAVCFGAHGHILPMNAHSR